MRNGEKIVWTVGHSAVDPTVLIGLLNSFGIDVLVDVRSSPYSRFAPQFNREALVDVLQQPGVAYAYMGASLGGRPDDAGLLLPNGKPDYIGMANTQKFVGGLHEVMELSRSRRVCLLCSEEDPTHCHRAMLVGDRLNAEGYQVIHIRHDGNGESQDDVERRRTGGQLVLF